MGLAGAVPGGRMAKGIEGRGKKRGTLSWTTGLWGKQAPLVSQVGAVSAPSLSSPWHRAWTQQVHRVRVTGAWALFLQGHWFRYLGGPGHGPCLGFGEREECGGSAPQAAPSSSACCVPAGMQARG